MSLNVLTAFVTIAATQFEPLVQFYSQLLEQEPHPFFPTTYAEFHLPALRLGIFRPKTPTSVAVGAVLPAVSLCLEVQNLEAAIAYLTDLGYPPPGSILTASHGREIYAYDPDGNCLILHETVHDRNHELG